jgi:O-succinylbenzoate synthase
MKIHFSPYQLSWAGNHHKAAREGALLKVLQPDGNFGYADCHPWIEFGDVCLKEQLGLLARGKTTPLTRQSLAFANIDGLARALQQNLFQGLKLPQNHYHISTGSLLSEALLERLSEEGFSLIKIKVGLNLEDDCAILNRFSGQLRANRLKLRLDFNSRLTEKEFLAFLKQNTHHLDIIDFFEDPFPYEPLSWQIIREKQKIKLACDLDSLKALAHSHSCDYLVVKPAIQDIAPFLTDQLKERHLVLTSYLDHPIGQLTGLYVAANVLKNRPETLSQCGFMTHHAYRPTPFSECFGHEGSRLIPSMKGYGFGYDNLLETLNWNTLS